MAAADFLVSRCALLFLPQNCYILSCNFVIKVPSVIMFPLCSKCCVEKHKDFCRHEEKEWALTGTLTTIKIDKAVALGYKLLEVKEVWHFEKCSSTLFSGFINALYKGKLETSSYPNNVVTTEEKLKYLAEIREHEGVELDMDKIAKNPGWRQMCKILLNSLW